uniref:NLE domain-containing protein n=1 Tax=Plectus sambesii TaxID=2011161 RepID=A0A914WK40_9BILA
MDIDEGEAGTSRVTVQLKSEEGDCLGAPFDLPVSVTVVQLQQLCNQLLGESDDPVPCAFYSNDTEIRESLAVSLDLEKLNTEKVLDIVYQPQAVFRVRAVTRCTSSLPGHGEAVISAQFSPDGRGLASGSGDTTVRFWDTTTELPMYTCKGHKHWVLCIAWAPNGRKLASACKSGVVLLWNPDNGEQMGKRLAGHKQWITCLAWEPVHINPECRQLASAGKDGDIRIWDTVQGHTVRTLAGHTACVTCIRWGGEGLLYSASQDRTIKVWRVEDGALCRTLQGHGHWVNTMALSVDYALRTGGFEPKDDCQAPLDNEQARGVALKRYLAAKGTGAERLVSGSDDFTLFLWQPSVDKKPIMRMTGHQQLINQVVFSPDTRLVASASFDKSVKLWCGRTGKYLASLRGHVQAVYQVSWSADSRLLVSGSADSTLKVWDMRSRRLAIDLPGHADEVYAVDWSPDGQRVVSGGKDKVLKLWRQ